jgi:hypothetical protein
MVLAVCLIFEFQRGEDLPRFPWEFWYVCIFFCKKRKIDFSLRVSDIVVESWYVEDLDDLKVVPLECLMGHLILAPIMVREQDIWITIPYDHVSI